MRNLLRPDDLGELGYQREARVQRDGTCPCPVDDLARRTLPEQTGQDGVGISDDPYGRSPRARTASISSALIGGYQGHLST
jgi:hypothetical protein